MNREMFRPKTAGENRKVVFDFANQLAVGVTLSSSATTSEVFSGVDASPSSMISGSSSISGTQVTQMIIGGTDGVVYDLICTAVTSDSQTLIRAGYLAVTD